MQTHPPATHQAAYPHTQHTDDDINLLELWQAIWQRKLILLATILISLVVGLTYLSIATPMYQASVLLSPTTAQKGAGRFASLASQYAGLAGLSGIALPSHNSLNTAIATLESRRFIQAFIQDNRLKPLIFPKQWDENSESWKPRPRLQDRWWDLRNLISRKTDLQPATLEPDLEQAYGKFKAALSVSTDNKTGLLNLHITWPEPQPAAQWANQLITRINQVLREQAIKKAENSIDYLNKQLKTARLNELRVLFAELIQEQTKNITLAQANEEYAFEILDPAVVPEYPIKPKRRMILVLSLVTGLVLGVIIALISSAVQSHKRKMALASTSPHLSP